ncbi:MAG TPA: HAD-IA family hydrolase [Planctomycetota bacterium]|nr:HAD-IA family hydrolase [Planctomycetota bacterium]
MSAAIGLDYQTFFDAWTGQTNIRRHTGSFPSFREEIGWICQRNGLAPSEEGLTKAIQVRYDFTRMVLVPRPDAIGTLESLRCMGLRTGLISDCSREVPELWPQTPFHRLFDAVIFSCSVGMKKPDPAIFHLACKRLGVVPGECFYIGDGFSNELSGARRCGMRPFLLLPPDEKPPESPGWEGATWDGERLPSLSSVLDRLGEEPSKRIDSG